LCIRWGGGPGQRGVLGGLGEGASAVHCQAGGRARSPHREMDMRVPQKIRAKEVCKSPPLQKAARILIVLRTLIVCVFFFRGPQPCPSHTNPHPSVSHTQVFSLLIPPKPFCETKRFPEIDADSYFFIQYKKTHILISYASSWKGRVFIPTPLPTLHVFIFNPLL